MGLPSIPLPTATVKVGGQDVGFHALSRAQATSLARFQDNPSAAEPFILACALDIDEAEAQAWLDGTPFAEATVLMEAIILLTGLSEAPKG